ncbi:luciferin sulfotransferase-like [Schistocerca nitens]|uniref:luciferin sulfotransferase-like n=1 Tax=Schistocerca nitens TaxID=7011 RepID=UPI0021173F75|nr:luciferin sulfotransferase-like [Schistocerca nitens]XP_049795531.1 luciferin sulfotransferase-like [Schistocerca nitens]
MSATAEVLTSPAARRYVDSLRGPYRDDHVRLQPSGCVLLSKVTKDVHRILDFAVRPDDVWLVTFPKSGTTWSQELLWLLMNNCDVEQAKRVPLIQRFPYLEITPLMPEFTRNMPHSIDHVERMVSPRLIKSHLPLDQLPKQIKTVKPKVIYVVRSVQDAIVSFYHHYQLWGDCDLTLDQFAECFMDDLIMYCPYWDHVLPFWNLRNEPNVLFYSYEDMKKDLASVIRLVATFLQKTITERQVAELVDYLSFDKMRNNPAVNYDPVVEQLRADYNLQPLPSSTKFMRRGQVGEGKQVLSEDIQRRLRQWTEAALQGSDYTGPR